MDRTTARRPGSRLVGNASGSVRAALPDSLPDVFRYGDARSRGLTDRQLRRLKERGAIDVISRGLYLRADAEPAEWDLVQLAMRAPSATLCLRWALARQGLIDDIPAEIDVAIPRGKRAPALDVPVRWHRFDVRTYQIGRDELSLPASLHLGIYSVERCIVDAFRLRHQEGTDLAHQALKTWLRRPGAQPASLLAMANAFPRTVTPLRSALELLL